MTIKGDASKSRLYAAFIDNIFAFAVMLTIVAFIPESLPQMKVVFVFLGYLGYFIVLEALWSRTVGKYSQGLVVRMLDGGPCTWPAALIRGGLRLLEINPLLFGGLPAGLVIISTPRKQRIGDLIAGTVVVSNKLVWEADSAEDTPEQTLADDEPFPV